MRIFLTIYLITRLVNKLAALAKSTMHMDR